MWKIIPSNSEYSVNTSSKLVKRNDKSKLMTVTKGQVTLHRCGIPASRSINSLLKEVA